MGAIKSCGIIGNRNKTQFECPIAHTHKIHEIMSTFFISEADLKSLSNFFGKIDVGKKGYITLLQLYILIKESPNKSEVSPFLDHLFSIVDKKFHDQITFEEFLPFLVSYCISSKYQLIQFVFNLIDTDHNNNISREQIMELFKTKRNDEDIFFINHPKRIREHLGRGIIRSDKLIMDDFIKLCTDLPFICFPAVQLQKKLRKYYINERFWDNFENHVRKAYIENITKKEETKMQHDIHNIREKVFLEKKKNLLMKWKNEEEEKFNNEIYEEQIRLTVPRRNSDTAFFMSKNRNDENYRHDCKTTNNINLPVSIMNMSY